MSLRQKLLRDNERTIESQKDFGLPVVLIDPDGTTHDTSATDDTRSLSGRIAYSNFTEDMNGNEIVSRSPTVTLNLGSLTRVPQAGEKWIVQIPPNPDSETLSDYTYERHPLISRGLGRVKLFLEIIEQS